jgi:hypothetical protein
MMGYAHSMSCSYPEGCNCDAGELNRLELKAIRLEREHKALSAIRILLNLDPQQDPEYVVKEVRRLLEERHVR